MSARDRIRPPGASAGTPRPGGQRGQDSACQFLQEAALVEHVHQRHQSAVLADDAIELMIGAFPMRERGVKPIQPGGLIYCLQ